MVMIRSLSLLLVCALLVLFSACGAAPAAPHEVTPAPASPAAQPSQTATPAPSTPAASPEAEPTRSPAPSPTPAQAPSAEPSPSEAPPETPEPPEETPTVLTPDELGALVEDKGDDLDALLSALEGVELDISYTPGEDEPVLNTLPEACRFLLPDGLREGDFVMEAIGGYDLYLFNRTLDDVDAIVENARAAGFEGLVMNTGFGITQFEGIKGPYAVELLYSTGSIILAFGLADAGVMSG